MEAPLYHQRQRQLNKILSIRTIEDGLIFSRRTAWALAQAAADLNAGTDDYWRVYVAPAQASRGQVRLRATTRDGNPNLGALWQRAHAIDPKVATWLEPSPAIETTPTQHLAAPHAGRLAVSEVLLPEF